MSAAPIGGLAVSPTDVSPIAQPRPKPPSSRRRSLQPSATSSPRASPSPKPGSSPLKHDMTLADEPNGDAAEDTYSGTLAGRSEQQLLSASRETLQECLRKEWAQRDKLAAQLDELGSAQREHEARTAKLQTAHEALQRKYDAAFAAQGSLEEQVEAANDIIDRLRKNLEDAERQVRTQQRRYADQEKAFEAERLVHQADQRGMVQRIKSLTAERIARPAEQAGDAQEALQEELMTLSASHQTLVAQLTTLTDELHEVKSESARLQEENDSWQLLIEEKTLDGTMRGGLIPSGQGMSPDSEERSTTPSSMRRHAPSTLETLEEQMEMDELHSELDAADARARSSSSNEIDLSSPTRPNGMSLASELGGGVSSSDVEALRNDVKRLKEANKALSLYCSKILDRIIASEGMEHILSVDYRTRRGSAPRLAGHGRPSVMELAKDMEVNGPPPMPARLPSPPSDDVAAPQLPSRRSSMPRPRPQSMYVSSESVQSARSVSSGSAATGASTPLDSGVVSQPRPNPADVDKRARRGFSIDFRSLGFGGAEKTEAKPQLKPLQLASRAAPAGAGQTQALSQTISNSPPKVLATPAATLVETPVVCARKLAPQEEDDEDRRERSRMEATLKLMGIDRSGTSPASTTGSLPPPEVPEKPAGAAASAASGAAAWLSRRLQRAPSNTSTTSASSQPTFSPAPLSPQPAERGVSPLARLSEALGSSGTGLELHTGAAAADPEAALREYDAREAEQARLLAEGKGPASYTSPPSHKRRSRSSASSSLSRGSGSGASAAAALAGSNGTASASPELNPQLGPPTNSTRHRTRESTSTLWSIGSSHASHE